MDKLNLGIIGLGCRGMGLLEQILKIDGFKVTAVCDTYKDRVKEASKKIKKAYKVELLETDDYQKVLNSENVSAVLIATSWEMHTKIACEAMRKGKYAAMEVGGVYDIQECWDLVKTYEETKTPFMFLENCCYGERELMCLNMAREGVFGEILQCEGAYCHDLRKEVSFGKENRHYRLEHYIHHNCENYPTHDLGPIAKILNINNGNRMLRLISVPTASKGLKEYIKKNKKDDKALLNTDFAQADIVTTMIECENGEIIRLTLETTLPRNYSRGFNIHGTKGMYQEDGDIVFLDGITVKKNEWYFDGHPWKLFRSGIKYAKKYAGPLWEISKKTRAMGHGGMDYHVLNAFLDSATNNTYPPIDVYDAAAWMCITALSEQSIKNGSAWVDIPDFTCGAYKTRRTDARGIYAIR